MTLAAWADVSQIIGAIAVIVSLGYVALQVRQNNKLMRRGEANVATSHGSALREAVISSRDVAELLNKGMTGVALDAADTLRFNAYVTTMGFIAWQVWDRARTGLGPKDNLPRVTAAIAPLLNCDAGRAWWRGMRIQFDPDFVTALESALPSLTSLPSDAPNVDPAE